MRKKIFLHIGFHKTGTSAIQYGLYLNRKRLFELGYLYPITGIYPESENKNHHLLGRHFDSRLLPKSNKTILFKLTKEIQKSHANHVILSFESFSILIRKDVKKFLNYLKTLGDVNVIAYVRPQTEWLFSLWSQFVKSGKSVNEWQEHVKIDSFRKQADFYTRLQPWSDIIGQENIRLGVFEKSQIRDNILFDYLSHCGIQDCTHFKPPSSINKSPGIKTLETIRYLTSILGVTRYPEADYISWTVARLVQQFGNEHRWDITKANLITNEQHMMIKSQFQASNKKLALTYLGRSELFKDQFVEKDQTKYSIEDLHPEELLQLMGYVIERLADKPYRIPKARRWKHNIDKTQESCKGRMIKRFRAIQRAIAGR